MNCIDHSFAQNKDELQHLSCDCTQFSIEKIPCRDSFTPETVITFLEKVKQDPNYQTDQNVMNCVAKLHRLVEPLVAFLNDMNSFRDLTGYKYTKWISDNIDRRLHKTADILIKKLFRGFDVAADLEERVKHLAQVPYEKWPVETEKLGVPVYWLVNGEYVKTRVSKDYLDRAVAVFLRERIQNLSDIDSFLVRCRRDYRHDWQVMQAMPHLEQWRVTFSEVLEKNPFASKEEILSLLEKTKSEIQLDELDEDLRKPINLLIDQFLFDHRALRTLAQEKKRWKEDFLENPSVLEKIICVLDEKDPTTFHIARFKELVSTEESNSDKNEKIYNAITNVFLAAVLVGLATQSIYSWVKRA